MPVAWRLVKERHAATAFTGEGAAKTGGRWNSRGMAVVYASSAVSLAALETLVHLNPPMFFKYVLFRVEFEATLVEVLAPKALPVDWQSEPPPFSTKAIGDAWLHSARSAVLAVPSVIVPQEHNLLINPAHPDFNKLSVGKAEPFAFDPRLIG